MFDRKNKFAALLVVLVAGLWIFPGSAEARKRGYGAPGFSFGMRAGYTPAAKFDMPPDPKSPPSAATFYAADPEIDLVKMTLGFSFEYYMHPAYSSTGAGYTQQTTPTLINYNGRLKLIPFISERKTFRTYYGMSYGISVLKVKGVRENLATTTSTLETAVASGKNTQYFAGMEFFLVQNYSMALEAGYRKLQIDKIKYTSNKNAAGNTRSKGDTVNRLDGEAASFGFNSYYLSAAFVLNF